MMTRRYLRLLTIGSAFTLSACAQHTAVHEVKQDVRTLNNTIRELNATTAHIARQNALNAHSSRGVYLLPQASTPARLQSRAGTLTMSLVDINQQADEMHATLHIEGDIEAPLPAFSASVVWGLLEDTDASNPETDVRHRRISVPATHQIPASVNVPLILRGVEASQPVFIRIHNVQPDRAH